MEDGAAEGKGATSCARSGTERESVKGVLMVESWEREAGAPPLIPRPVKVRGRSAADPSDRAVTIFQHNRKDELAHTYA